MVKELGSTAVSMRSSPTTDSAIFKLIAATRTTAGLTVKAHLHRHAYQQGRTVSQPEFDRVRLRPEAFHGDWNCTIFPAPRSALILLFRDRP